MAEDSWCRLLEATRVARRTQNQLYRLAALGLVETRRNRSGRLEFAVRDLQRIAAADANEETVSLRSRRSGAWSRG